MSEDKHGASSSRGHNNILTDPSSSTSPFALRRIYPGFLSTEEEDSDPIQHRSSASPPLPSPVVPSLPMHDRKSRPAALNLDPTQSATESTSHRTPGLYPPFSSARSSATKRRPAPLQLANTPTVGVDEESQEQRGFDSPLTGTTVINEPSTGSLQDEMADLSLLRNSVRQNMVARPLDSPLSTPDSGGSSSRRKHHLTRDEKTDDDNVAVDDMIDILVAAESESERISSSQILVLDTRPLGEFLESHLPRSANVSIPSLIFKRFRNASKGSSASLNSLGSFVTTQAGRRVWDQLDASQPAEIFVLGPTAGDETAKVLQRVMKGLMPGQIRLVRGGWKSVSSDERARDLLVQGEQSIKAGIQPPRTSSGVEFPPPPPPKDSVPRIARHPSLPSLRQLKKPNLPALTINGTKRPPKLSLNLDRGTHSDEDTSKEDPNHEGASQDGTRTPMTCSFQALCHAQSKLPPSPSSFGGVSRSTNNEISLNSPFLQANPSWSTSTARPGRGPLSAAPHSARSGDMAPFIVSTILPNFLYLGPEISSIQDVEELEQIGIKRILNVALECDNEDLKVSERFERYLKLPMRDIVEESGVGKGMRDACDFLDDARLHSAPTYVHCKAGKSRSVTVVLAYLIHANAWPLKTAYAYVAERRKGISPNIGFVAELMQFEETELGVRQSGGVHGETAVKEEKSKPPVRLRESLPPAWASSMDDAPKWVSGNEEMDEEHRKAMGDEREVKKNGQWVYQRRAPFDRTTLQPGRRVSKAGLESLLGFSTAGLARPSPKADPEVLDGGDKPHTPGGEGRIGWV